MRILLTMFITINFLFAFNPFGNKAIYNTVGTIIVKSSNNITESSVSTWAKKCTEKGGLEVVKKEIGTLNLSNQQREAVFLRIATKQEKINSSEANQLFDNLKGVEGFSSTLSKIIGNNPLSTSGHLNELRIANNSKMNGFTVKAIGKKFDDGIKSNLTDVDIILNKNNRDILIEAKRFSETTNMSIENFKKDLDTLNIYDKKFSKGKALKIFTITEKPKSEKLLNQYQTWAKKKNVELLFGEPEDILHQIKLLEGIKK